MYCTRLTNCSPARWNNVRLVLGASRLEGDLGVNSGGVCVVWIVTLTYLPPVTSVAPGLADRGRLTVTLQEPFRLTVSGEGTRVFVYSNEHLTQTA